MSQPLRAQPAGEGAADADEVTYLTVREVAAILRVSLRHVHNLCHAGELEYVMPGRLMRIAEPSLRAYIKRNRKPASA